MMHGRSLMRSWGTKSPRPCHRHIPGSKNFPGSSGVRMIRRNYRLQNQPSEGHLTVPAFAVQLLSCRSVYSDLVVSVPAAGGWVVVVSAPAGCWVVVVICSVVVTASSSSPPQLIMESPVTVKRVATQRPANTFLRVSLPIIHLLFG